MPKTMLESQSFGSFNGKYCDNNSVLPCTTYVQLWCECRDFCRSGGRENSISSLFSKSLSRAIPAASIFGKLRQTRQLRRIFRFRVPAVYFRIGKYGHAGPLPQAHEKVSTPRARLETVPVSALGSGVSRLEIHPGILES